MRRFFSSWAWLLALFSIAGFIETMFWGQMSGFTPLYLPKLGVAPEQVPTWTGAIAALSGAIGIPFLPLWGALADRYARQPIIVRSFVAHLIAGVLAILARNIWVFVLARAAMSFALGNSGLMMTTLTERAPRERQGLSFAIMNSAAPLGAFVGPLLGGPIVDKWGFPALIGVNTVLMAVVILALSLGYRDSFRGTDRGPLFQMAVDSVRIIGQSSRLRVLFIALFILFAGWMIAFTYVPLAITALYSGDDPGTAIGIVLGAGGLVTLILSPVVGSLADRFGHWRVLIIGAAASVALWPLPALTPNLVLFTIAWAALNGVMSGVFAISFSVLSDSATTEVRGRVMSFAYLPVNVGSMIGPAIGSVATQISVFAVFPVAAVLTALGVGMLAVARRR
ncbi:MAG: MFS transporter [Chloroflexi bacterium]|nr:MFS transporter [Chloroflexota bacterium]